jgi:predicted transcriptional regulator
MDDLKVDQWNPVRASNLSNDAIVKLAESVATQCGYKPGDDLRDIVEKKLRGKLSFAELDELGNSNDAEFFGDDIRIKGKQNFEIRISPLAGSLRARFSIAHEIGHYVLHFLYPNQLLRSNLMNVRAYRSGGDLAEREANWFAANFLMPKDRFKDSFEENRGQISKIATEFKVSQPAAFYRAKGLSLITEA